MIIKNKLLLTISIILCTGILPAQEFPLNNFDYFRVTNGVSPSVTAIGGINLANASYSHSSYYNPALLAFREQSAFSLSVRQYLTKNEDIDGFGLPAKNSLEWNSDYIGYLGFEAPNIAASYLSMSAFTTDKKADIGGTDKRFYSSYFLDAYRLSLADNNNNLAFGVNLSFLNGRFVYLREREDDTGDMINENFVDSRVYGYSLDFGAVVRWEKFSYGLMIPNTVSRMFWNDYPNKSLERRLQMGVQYGDDTSFVTSGFSRRFVWSAKNVYHSGFQHIVGLGMFKGHIFEMPLRVGAYGHRLRKFKDLSYSIGTGIQYGYFTFDTSFSVTDKNWDKYIITSSISVGL